MTVERTHMHCADLGEWAAYSSYKNAQAEIAREKAEAIRDVNEKDRIDHEILRHAAERDRQKQEELREAAEKVRQENEAERVASEKERIANEGKRVESEQERKALYDNVYEDYSTGALKGDYYYPIVDTEEKTLAWELHRGNDESALPEKVKLGRILIENDFLDNNTFLDYVLDGNWNEDYVPGEGSGQTGTNDYNALINKPRINGTTIQGSLTSHSLGLQDEGERITNDEIDSLF